MNKKKLIIVIIIILFILAIGGGFLFSREQSTQNESFSLPIGSDVERTVINTPVTSEEPTFLTINRFRRISKRPIAGYIVFNQTSTSSPETIVRYVDRATGSLYEVRKNSTEPYKLIASTFPKSIETTFAGPHAYLSRTLSENDEIISQITTLKKESDSSYSFNTTSLDVGITSVSGSPNGLFSFILPSNEQGLLTIWDAHKNNVLKKVIIPLSDMNTYISSKDEVFIYTPPSNLTQGFVYSVNINTGRLTPILRKIPGLSVSFSKDASSIVYSSTSKDDTFSFIKKRNSANPQVVPFKAFAGECGWLDSNIFCPILNESSKASFIDDWYKGKVNLMGTIFAFKPSLSQEGEYIMDSPQDIKFDIKDIQIDPQGKYLYFINRFDLSLWEYSLVE